MYVYARVCVCVCVEKLAETADLSSETPSLYFLNHPPCNLQLALQPPTHTHKQTHTKHTVVFFHSYFESTVAHTNTHSSAILPTAHCPLIAN